jgi:Icc-related predicted phosphoesterase
VKKLKIYAVADIHGSQYRLNLVLKNIQRHSPDLVVVCGDITQFGPGDVAKNFLDQIPIETVAVTGNIDSTDVEKAIDDSKATRIELKKVVKKGIPFVGASGVNPDHFKILSDKKMIDENTVIVTHVPAFDTVDKIFIGMHGGSKELRSLVDEHKPRLVLSGHIHESPGFTKINKTVFVNCSIGKRGEGALIDINEEISVKMLE